MEQSIPQVSDSDVERIIKRDLPMEEQEGIRVIMGQLEVREKPRVVLACLKNSGGGIRKLKNNLAEAPGYYREFIAEAEYPNYMKKVFRIEQLSEAEKSKIIEKDKKQYLAWLHEKNKNHAQQSWRPNTALEPTVVPLARCTVAAVRTCALRSTRSAGGCGSAWIRYRSRQRQ